ncbi:MAG: nucleotidyltransferase family protein [candidate division Zixibacteria bacterium]|nr:nucleotidyltransferase family protein [candidate division Zixibacteria bacterium]
MNAFLLAGGLGTRLRPLTNTIPKCLVDICGKPLLQWWLDNLIDMGIEKVLINTHHLPDKVKEFVDGYQGNIDTILFYENELLGSAGTVRCNKVFIDNTDFLIIYADNLTNIDLHGMIDFHKSQESIFTMGVMEMTKPETRGIAVLGTENVVTDFVEKSPSPPGNMANAGIMIASPKIYDYFDSDTTPLDFGYDILPKLIGTMYGYELKGYLQDIGNPDDLKSARENWNRIWNSQQKFNREYR